jgi:chromosome transmission fidelity protein 18
MEMDMDMPDPDELEWMESHSLLPEEEEDIYFDDPDEGFVPPTGDLDQPRDSSHPSEPAPLRASMHHSPSLYISTRSRLF